MANDQGAAASPAPLLRILGTRGVPATHGGFETFAEALALYLVDRGWRVVVYCQTAGTGPIEDDVWQGVERVLIPSGSDTSLATITFDWKSTGHAARLPGICLTLGYNTAIFCGRLRIAGRRNLINMDGIEWRRAKWGRLARLWFRLNERAATWFADHLIADHPAIAAHLEELGGRCRTTVIPYGADHLIDLPTAPVQRLGLEPGRYFTLIARPEPENSVLEIVRGWSARRRGMTLAVLGSYKIDNEYHCEVRAGAGSEVKFLGAIYDKETVQALRMHGAGYVHGHQVGGTNPSLVEALGAANAVLAHDNRFNRWVAADAAVYFEGEQGFDSALTALLAAPEQLSQMRSAAARRLQGAFRWDLVLEAYEALLRRYLTIG